MGPNKNGVRLPPLKPGGEGSPKALMSPSKGSSEGGGDGPPDPNNLSLPSIFLNESSLEGPEPQDLVEQGRQALKACDYLCGKWDPRVEVCKEKEAALLNRSSDISQCSFSGEALSDPDEIMDKCALLVKDWVASEIQLAPPSTPGSALAPPPSGQGQERLGTATSINSGTGVSRAPSQRSQRSRRSSTASGASAATRELAVPEVASQPASAKGNSRQKGRNKPPEQPSEAQLADIIAARERRGERLMELCAWTINWEDPKAQAHAARSQRGRKASERYRALPPALPPQPAGVPAALFAQVLELRDQQLAYFRVAKTQKRRQDLQEKQQRTLNKLSRVAHYCADAAHSYQGRTKGKLKDLGWNG